MVFIPHHHYRHCPVCGRTLGSETICPNCYAPCPRPCPSRLTEWEAVALGIILFVLAVVGVIASIIR